MKPSRDVVRAVVVPHPGRPRRTVPGLRVALVAMAVTLQACASGAGGSSGVRRDPNMLTAEDLAPVVNLSIYDAVQRLRPNWLRPRGATSVSNMGDQMPAVMVDNAFQSIDFLRSLQVTGVNFVRFIDARDATTRYGTGYVNGIVEVVMAGES